MGPWTPRHYLSTLLVKKRLLLPQLLLFHPFSQKYVDDDVVVGTRFNYTNRRRQEWETRSSGILSLFIYGETSLLLSRVFFFPFLGSMKGADLDFQFQSCPWANASSVVVAHFFLHSQFFDCWYARRARPDISRGLSLPERVWNFLLPSSCSPYGFVVGDTNTSHEEDVSLLIRRGTQLLIIDWRARDVTFNFQNYTARTVPS